MPHYAPDRANIRDQIDAKGDSNRAKDEL